MTRTAHPAARLVTAGLACLVLAGCSGESDEPAAEPGTEQSTTAAGSVSPPDLPEVPEVREPVGAVADLELGECATGAGEQSVTGEVVNGGNQQRDVLVVVSWTNDTSDVLGRAVEVVRDVDPGETRELDLTADVAEGATQCVPNVRRGVVAQ